MDAAQLEKLKAGGHLPQSGNPSSSDTGDSQKQQQQQEEARRDMLAQIIHPSARERLGRIALVKEERARAIEDMLIRMARSGQIKNKVTEDELKGMLEEINTQHHKETQITYSRKDALDSDDDEEYNFD